MAGWHGRDLLFALTRGEVFSVGESYSLTEFIRRSRTALDIASERVKVKYGFHCSRAMAQLSRIETAAAAYLDFPHARVTVNAFEE